MHRLVALAIASTLASSLLLSGCDPACKDDPDGTACQRGDDGSHTEFHGEAFPVRGVGPAGDQVAAVVDHIDYDGDMGAFELLQLDRFGALVSITEIPDLPHNTLAVAGNGRGSALLLSEDLASFLQDGVEIGRLPITDEVATTFANDEYWLALASAPRQLLRYDTSGNRREMIVLPDLQAVPGVPSAPSFAIDPVGDGFAVAWTMTYSDHVSIFVNRLGGTVSDVELARSTVMNAWSTTVAMHAGTAAIIFGGSKQPPQLARLAPDGTVSTKPVLSGEFKCEQLVGTVAGYVATCRTNPPYEVRVYIDDAGVVQGTESGLPTNLVATRGAAIAIENGPDFSLETRVLDASFGTPANHIFDGSTSERVDDGIGCSATGSSSTWLVALALLGLLSRRLGPRRARSRS